MFTSMFSRLTKTPLIKKITSRFDKKAAWIIVIFTMLAAAGGIAYYQLAVLPGQTAGVTTMQTAAARQGNLVIYASGTGTLIASDEVSLSFNTGGQITKVFFNVGDTVKAGDLLAQVDDTSAQIAYTIAKRTLLELTSTTAIASAQQNITTATTNLQNAKKLLEYYISPRVYYWESEIQKAEQALEEAQTKANSSPNDEQIKKELEKAKNYLAYAKANLISANGYYTYVYLPKYFETLDKQTKQKYIAAPTENDILGARAAVTEAEALLEEANYLYTALTGGEIPENATGAGITALEQAKLGLQSAQVELDGTRIYTAISGTVMAVNASAGDTVSASSPVITVADLSQPYLEVFLDASDWVNISLGYAVDVTFDILPGRTFSGKVTQVDPGLYAASGTSVIRALVQLTNINNDTFNLPLGTSAAVDVIGGRAENVVLVPVEALRKAGDQYTVFVMENGKPILRVVEVGIQDLLYAEIKSGLKAGDIVTTGITETQ